MATTKTENGGKKGRRNTAPAIAVAQVGETTLEQIVEATQDAARGFAYTAPGVHGPFVEAGLVEINLAMVDEHGNIATRATQKGIDSVQGSAENTDTNSATAETKTCISTKVKTMFKIEDAIPVPAISGRGRGGETYPFEQLQVGQSFFVANSESKPNAAKSLASTVSSATARYAVPAEDGSTKTNKKGETVPVMVETRKFIVRSVEGGARVWRTQ